MTRPDPIAVDDVAVVSPAYYGDSGFKPARYLAESADILGIPIRWYGLGKPWPGLIKGKMDDLINHLENLTQPFTLFTDSYDSFFVAPLTEILGHYTELGRPDILSAAEQNCYPDGSLAPHFLASETDEGQQPTPYNFVCPGSYIGRTEKIVKHLRELRYRYKDMPEPWAGNDQCYWHWGWRDGLTVGLDRYCRIFQLMGGEREGNIGWAGADMVAGEPEVPTRLVNMTTQTAPCLLHFNGRTGNNGVMEAYFWRWATARGRTV